VPLPDVVRLDCHCLILSSFLLDSLQFTEDRPLKWCLHQFEWGESIDLEKDVPSCICPGDPSKIPIVLIVRASICSYFVILKDQHRNFDTNIFYKIYLFYLFTIISWPLESQSPAIRVVEDEVLPHKDKRDGQTVDSPTTICLWEVPTNRGSDITSELREMIGFHRNKRSRQSQKSVIFRERSDRFKIWLGFQNQLLDNYLIPLRSKQLFAG
jgi:hypothetical protein